VTNLILSTLQELTYGAALDIRSAAEYCSTGFGQVLSDTLASVCTGQFTVDETKDAAFRFAEGLHHPKLARDSYEGNPTHGEPDADASHRIPWIKAAGVTARFIICAKRAAASDDVERRRGATTWSDDGGP
jgi:hypothetical protein